MEVKFNKNTVEYLDEATGEVHDVVSRGGRVPSDKEFAMVTFDAWLDAKLSSNETRILIALSREMDRKGRAIATLGDIAEIVGVARTSAWRIIDAMCSKDILRRRGRADLYVNPNIIWRGSAADRAVACIRWGNEIDAKRDGRSV